MQDAVQDNQRKLPHFTGAVQDKQDKTGLSLMKVVGGDVAVELEVLESLGFFLRRSVIRRARSALSNYHFLSTANIYARLKLFVSLRYTLQVENRTIVGGIFLLLNHIYVGRVGSEILAERRQ